jgi:hypothetical protein
MCSHRLVVCLFVLPHVAALSVGASPATNGWQTYSSGILGAGCGGAADVDHCVQVVGYNDGGAKPYWIVRNSWNTDWGIDGYIYVQKGINACDIAGEVTYVTGAAPAQ